MSLNVFYDCYPQITCAKGILYNRYKDMRISIYILTSLVICMVSLSMNGQQSTCKHRHHNLRSFSGAERSDTVDVKHYDIALDFTQASALIIKGVCTVTVEPLMVVDQLVFDFQGLTVDSIHIANTLCTFDQSSVLLVIQTPSSLIAGEEVDVDFHYHGQPQQDQSGWGGFYFSNSYAFNLGVGFDADPHSFGRVWHPCFDNFVERASYTQRVLTSDNKTSYCGGVLIEETTMSDSTLRVWELEATIPAYLASVATGNYVHASRNFESMTGDDIPVWLAALAGDTLDMTNSFQNLIPALEAFETDFGPYRWPRVGYVAVPFSGGAMEHACNIAYPLFAANGNLTYQTLMAHELAHHWWGDLVTCSTQEDMWLNEGMASFCEALFVEAVDGYDSYIEYVRDNHKDVLLFAHQRDGARLPVSGISHEYTYGDHVYNKGADVAYNLRTYLGDDYFPLMTAFLEDHQFSDVSSENLRDYLQNGTSADLTSFFDNWIFAPGFPEFREADVERIDNGDGTFTVNYSIEQYLHYAPSLYQNVPLEISFLGATGEVVNIDVIVSGESTSFTETLDFEPIQVIPNRNDKLSEAMLAEEISIESEGIKQFNYCDFRVDVDVLPAPLSLRVENHWAEADNPSQPEYRISPDRFWRVRGQFAEGFQGTGRMRMYGVPSATNYFDPLLSEELMALNYTEDSLIVVYRENNQMPWVALNTSINTQGVDNNFQCYADFSMMGSGDYALAYATGETGVHGAEESHQVLYPNPASEFINLGTPAGQPFTIIDQSGKLVLSGTTSNQIDVRTLAAGTYTLVISGKSYSFIKN
ncbi:MAG: T9SS type A sorting domain-containing protein [Cryomorphaceae bacterium]|nr:T9SS type A sorting domain-containing protein [Cryomorphaceae bacterium]